MTVYYNEFEPYAATWLRNLITAGHIADGVVDTRSIEDVRPSDLTGFAQCHFFAGIGVWSYALRAAGWPDYRPVWTGSCPCQPFSAAGEGLAFADERHLWPAFHHLIKVGKPPVVVGEQVASKAVDAWIDLVHADLEALGYAFGSVPFPSAGVGAPHIRDRNYWVGHAIGTGLAQRERERGILGGTAEAVKGQAAIGAGIYLGGLGDTKGERCGEARAIGGGSAQRAANAGATYDMDSGAWRGPTNGLWADADWIFCRDGKWRPVSAKPQPMVDGSASSLGRVCAGTISQIEGEINAWSVENKINGAEAVRDLHHYLGAQSNACWSTGRLPRLHEAPFLLAFMRQLTEQGWRYAQCLSTPRSEDVERSLRMLRSDRAAPGAPRKHELAGQQPEECADPMPFLSSLLARYAHTAWDHAYATYAEIGFPLAHGARSRVGRLRAYGNAINAEQARIWIETVMECQP